MSLLNVPQSRFNLAVFLCLSLALATGCLIYFDFVSAILAGLLLSSALLILFRQWKAWCLIALLYGSCLLLLLVACMVDDGLGGTYAQWYNYRLENLAMEANLIGRDEDDIESVLGRSTYEYSSWSSTDAETGEPAEDAELRTTYKFSPYPVLPTVQGFEVHCQDGKVMTIELFDD